MQRRKWTKFWQARSNRTAWLLLSPALLILGLVLLYPLLNTLWLSLQHKVLIRPLQDGFVGLDNYLKALSNPEVRAAAVNTFVFTLSSVAAKLLLGMIGALLLNVPMRGAAWVRSFYMLPWLVPTVVAAMAWRWIFNDQFGIANEMIRRVGGSSINWLGEAGSAMFAVVLVDVWRGLPLMTILLLAGLQSIPRDSIEAAMIDGAGAWQRFWKVTLPQMRAILFMSGTLSLIGTFNSFNIIYVMTGGGPAHATDILVTHVFRVAFQGFDFGMASTLAVLIIALIALLTGVYGRMLNRRGGADVEA